jgi:stage IV sporulation protein FB
VAGRSSYPRFGASLKLGSLLGIPIRLHFTFLLVIGWLLWRAVSAGGDAYLWLFLLVLLFGCVVLHELGHASMAMLFGVRTREIVLLPIGGLARMERMPLGAAELLIAIAGPAVNLALALLFSIVGLLIGLPSPGDDPSAIGMGSMIWMLVFANFSLMLFNLLPAFPLDGGRVLRAVLTFVMPVERATLLAGRIGQAMAVLLVLAGLTVPNPILILVALLVFMGAAQEMIFQKSRSAILDKTAREAMITRYETLAPQNSLEEASKLMLEGDQQVFPVVDVWGRVAGVVTRSILFEGIARLGSESAVLEVMEREFPTSSAESPLEGVLEKLQNMHRLPVLVIEEEKLVGMVTSENLGEMVELARLAKSGKQAKEV